MNNKNECIYMHCDAIAREIYVPLIQLHKHHIFEISYVLKGSGTNIINNIPCPYKETACFIIRPSDSHVFTNTPVRPNPEEYKHIDIYVTQQKFKQVCDSISPTFYQDILDSKEPIAFHLSNSLIQVITNKINALIFKSATNEVLDIFQHFVLTTLLSAYFEQLHYQQTTNYPQWLNELLLKLQTIEFLSMNITQLATHFNYSAAHLSREFKKHIGIKLLDYIQNERIKYSLSLLQSQNLKIIEIAEILGYEKQSTFSALFKKIMHCSPKEYQMKANTKQEHYHNP